MKFLSILLLLLICLPNIICAKQLNFSKKTTDEQAHLSYQWLDHDQQPQALSFTMDKAQIFDQFRNFRSYHASSTSRYIKQKLRKKLKQHPIANVTVKFLRLGNELQIELKGENQTDIAQAQRIIAKLEHELMQEHLAKNFYTQFVSYDNNLAIKPDHARIAKESVDDFKALKPLILDSVSIQSVRQVGDYVLGFVQSIPYSTLESRVTSTGAGFNPPLQTLWQNQGDCDSKVTLTAAIFRSLMPRIKMLLVFIDNHALLAINIPSIADELTITVDGLDYILAEPTGPAMMRIGELAEDSEFAIRNGRYYAEPFFADPNTAIATTD